MNRIFKIFSNVINVPQYFQNFSTRIQQTVGVAIIGFGLVFSYLISIPLVTPLIAWVITLFGASILFPAVLQSKLQSGDGSATKQQIDTAVAHARIQWEADEQKKLSDRLRKDLSKQLQENEDLQLQMANLKATQMVATSWQQNLQMVLLEVNHTISDWRERHTQSSESSTLSRGKSHIYRGLLDKTFTAKLGFNLERLRVHVPNGSSTLLITLPEVDLVGVSNIQTVWRHKHLEVSLAKSSIRSGERQIHDEHPDLNQEAEEQARILESRVNAGGNLQYLHPAVQELAKRILRLILGPIHSRIEFVSELSADGTTLTEYLHHRHKEAEERIKQIESQQQQLLEQLDQPIKA
jgi:hypothetical protein